MSFSGILAMVSSWIPTVIAALASNAVKVTLLLLVTGVAALVLRKRSSAARHAVWCAALVGALLFPVFTLAVPEWKLPVLPAAAPRPAVSPAAIVPTPAPLPPVVPATPRHVHRHAPLAPHPAPSPNLAP